MAAPLQAERVFSLSVLKLQFNKWTFKPAAWACLVTALGGTDGVAFAHDLELHAEHIGAVHLRLARLLLLVVL